MKKIAKIGIDQLRINLPILSTRKHIKTKRNKMWDEFDFTINDIDQLLSLKKILSKPAKRDTGKNGYNKSLVYGSIAQGGFISIMYNRSRKDMGVLVEITATGKKVYESLCRDKGIIVDWKKIISQVYQEFRGHLSRIDIAIDFINYNYLVSDIWNKLQEEQYLFLNARNQKINSQKIKGINSVEGAQTIYVGSRKSDSYLRIYDKKVEQLKKKGIYYQLANKVNNWTRIEGEFKHRESKRIGSEISTMPMFDLNSYLAEIILRHWKLVAKSDKED